MSLARLVPGVLACALALPAQAAEDSDFRRFVLLAGANDGGPGRVALRYAVEDARSVGSVLGQLGGVEAGDSVMLTQPDRQGLIAALADMRGRIASAEHAGARTELLVYYSGHSDEAGLLIGADRFGYDELRAALDRMPADVRVVILDSCSSGAFVRGKGGVARPAFLVDESSDVRGNAYLTSSSADEAAQESDRLGGSFFTHYLVTGLRGAADYTDDGRVTLTEAYQFAYNETLSRTSRTQAGPQHPTNELGLVGTGDLVITDVRATTAGLVADEEIEGRLLIRDAQDRLVAELYKPKGRRVELGLVAGRYEVLLEEEKRLREAEFTVATDGMVRLSSLDFHEVESEVARARGGDPSYRDVAFSVGLIPPLALNQTQGERQHVAISLGWNSAAALDGGQVALLANHVRDDARGVQASVAVNVVGDTLKGVQTATGLNKAGEVRGAQLSAGGNWTDGELDGAQITAGVNVARAPAKGVQASAGLNVTAEGLVGAQLTSGVNIAGGETRGAQVGIVDIAEDIEGAQVSIINVGKDVDGIQVGIINVGKDVKGTQIGLINVSDDIEGAPIGLLSFSRTGYNHAKVWMDATGMANVGLTFGGKHVYSLVSAGTFLQDPTALWTVQLGLGGHLQRGKLYLDLEASAGNLGGFAGIDGHYDSSGILTRGRATVGLDVAKHLSVFVGPTFDLVSYPGQHTLPDVPWVVSGEIDNGERRLPWLVGAAAGVRF